MVIQIKEFIFLSNIGNSVGFTIQKSQLEALDLNYGDLIEIEILKEYQGYTSLIITRSLRKAGSSLRVSLNPQLLNALNLKERDGIQVDIRKFEKVDKSEKPKVQILFDELNMLFIRLYRSKASSSPVFARTIHSSIDMQKYFGITIKGSASPGKDLDDFEIYFLDRLFKVIPNSAQLSFDDERMGKYGVLINKNKAPSEIEQILEKFFNYIIKFVSREFSIKLEFKENISI